MIAGPFLFVVTLACGDDRITINTCPLNGHLRLLTQNDGN